MSPQDEDLRPSLLPLLEHCSSFRGSKTVGEAANRGSRLDVAYRAILEGDEADYTDLTADDEANLEWATRVTEELSQGDKVVADPEKCRVSIPLIERGGEMDAFCSSKGFHIDLKSGIRRDYRKQQEAYALGMMETQFASKWTCYVLYLDERAITTYEFTYDEAMESIRQSVAKFHDGAPATACDYCGWCRFKFDCDARKESLGILPIEIHEATGADWEAESVRDLMLHTRVCTDYVEQAKGLLREKFGPGANPCEGLKVQSNNAVRATWPKG